PRGRDPQVDELADQRFVGTERRERRRERAELAARPGLVPIAPEVLRIETEPRRHLGLQRDLALDVEVDERVPQVEDDCPRHAPRTFTAVPYAQISVQLAPISEVSKRIPTIAFAPFASASWTIRSITCWRESASAFVIPFSSPPKIDFSPAPNCEPM